jgi:hypothetical protein
MKPRLSSLLLLLAFALAVGDFAFRTWNPQLAPKYMVEAMVQPLTLSGEGAGSKHLYLRRSWHFTRPPEQAWIELLGHDVMELYVNGRMAGRSDRKTQSDIAALSTDITPFLHVGKNSIAIHVAQTTLNRPPAVAIHGECQFADGSQHAIDGINDWRATDVYDRRGAFWFETEFEDEHWGAASVSEPVTWRGQVDLPPRAITVPRRSYWIVPADSQDGAAAFARDFELPGLPREGWLRVLATGPYRLAVNGWIVANDRFELAQTDPPDAIERTFDISALLKRGRNTISLAVTTAGEAPRLRADLEATTRRGEHVYVATDGDWKSRAGHVPDWHRVDLKTFAEWQPCRAEIGYLSVVPRRVLRELAELKPPALYVAIRYTTYLGMVALLAAIAWLGCSSLAPAIRRSTLDQSTIAPDLLPYLALVPSTVAAATARLMLWDPAWSANDIYRPLWLAALLFAVVAQWLLIAITTKRANVSQLGMTAGEQRTSDRWRRIGWAACWIVVAGAALWLRVRDIVAEPIHHDEVGAYAFTQGVLKHGFPGGQTHPDLPFGYCSTSELAYYPTALCELFFDDPRLVLRVPAVAWSMAALALLAYLGARWFNPYVGLVAAVLYALSPHAIGWANLGRYLSQVQFFTLLTMFFTYEAFRNSTVRGGMVWAAAVSMAATYLSWEGAGMFGIGLALAVLVLRRNDMRKLISCPAVYTSGLFVILVVAAQNAHRVLQQTQRMWYGEGISDLALKPMWRYPFFDVDFFLMNASWMRDALLPMIAFAIACFMAVRHRWRVPLRFCIICLASNALIMAAVLPLRTNRYSYHLVPILVILAAAVIVAGAELFWRVGREARLAAPHRAYARAVAVGVLLMLVALASGRVVRTSELSDFAVAAYDVGQLRYPHWDGPTDYLRQQVREGDVVIATFPHTQNFLVATAEADAANRWQVDYWLESTLLIQATIGDSRAMPLDRRSGTAMIYDLDQLRYLFANHDRVWYCTMRFGQSRINDTAVSKFMRENMDVVYEDFGTAIMLRDKNHRTAPLRVEEEEAGRIASEYYLR